MERGELGGGGAGGRGEGRTRQNLGTREGRKQEKRVYLRMNKKYVSQNYHDYNDVCNEFRFSASRFHGVVENEGHPVSLSAAHDRII